MNVNTVNIHLLGGQLLKSTCKTIVQWNLVHCYHAIYSLWPNKRWAQGGRHLKYSTSQFWMVRMRIYKNQFWLKSNAIMSENWFLQILILTIQNWLVEYLRCWPPWALLLLGQRLYIKSWEDKTIKNLGTNSQLARTTWLSWRSHYVMESTYLGRKFYHGMVCIFKVEWVMWHSYQKWRP